MTNFGDFALHLVCRRAKSALMSYDSYPTRFLLLGLEGGEAQVGKMKQNFDDYQAIKHIGGDWWTAVRDQHALSNMCNIQVFEALKQGEW
eukprot:3326431-Pyramimonas_sp.AAC.1